MVGLRVRFSKFWDIGGLGFTSNPKIYNLVLLCVTSPLRSPKPLHHMVGLQVGSIRVASPPTPSGIKTVCR